MSKRVEAAKQRKADEAAAPLTPGALLRQLDGGADCPGRLLAMTTNRVELLDAALKRPGRCKLVRFDNLMFGELKEMVLH